MSEASKPQTNKNERKERREAKSKAYDVLKELVDQQKDAKYKSALQTVRPSLYGIVRTGGGTSSLVSQVVNEIITKNQVSEMDLFKAFKVGRKECLAIFKKSLKKAEPKSRVWIELDPKTGMYKVVGRGEKPPATYTGYVPVAENVTLK